MKRIVIGLIFASTAAGTRADDAATPTASLSETDAARQARLLDEFRAFQLLPPEKQDRVRRLDQDLHHMPPPAAARLQRSLARYVDWLDGLPEQQRRHIESAPDSNERLKRIRELRQNEWIARLPKSQRDQINASQGTARAALIDKIRKDELKRKKDWQAASRHWDELQRNSPPTKRTELPGDARAFVDSVLSPRLTTADSERLKGAEGDWPRFLETLIELSDRYVPFPGPAKPVTAKDLPEEMRKRMANLRPMQRLHLQSLEGKWPDYPLALSNAFRRPQLPPVARLGPVRPTDFDEPLQAFLKNQLVPRLTPDERKELLNAEGKWPEYPKTIARLAGAHQITVPGMLPLAKGYADKYRAKNVPTQ
jgi:Ni/Co efflux regulator RcnB